MTRNASPSYTPRAVALLAALGAALAVACGPAPTPAPSTPAPDSLPTPLPGPGPAPAPERPKLTRAQCEAAGGEEVPDIGDGSVHKPDYRCASSGEAPLGTIEPEPGGPIAIEGSVCCPTGEAP